MPLRLTFNMLLAEAGIAPADVRLMRHQHVARDGLTPYALWRDNPSEFERYQSAQRVDRRPYYDSRYWAGFVVPPDGTTLFVGLYEIDGHDPVAAEWVDPLLRATAAQMGRELDIYRYRRIPELDHLIGCLKVDWGAGARTWAQKASSESGNKPIIELLPSFREPDFPGYTAFIGNLGRLAQPSSDMDRRLVCGTRRLSADLSSYSGTVCRLGVWRKWPLGALASLRSDGPRRQCRAKEP